jgi:peptide-methionine (R)-S-oxide reductase
MRRSLLRFSIVWALLLGCSPQSEASAQDHSEHRDRFSDPPIGQRLTLSEAEWRRRLTPEEFHVLREEGTEPAFSGRWHDNHADGLYRCAGCGAPLFRSSAKFESGTGWPSFWQPIEGRVATREDRSLGIVRTEVHCARCGGHLGHVFEDGPAPSGLRYCMNSIALDFEARRH